MRDFLDFHAPFSRSNDGHARRGAVKNHSQVQLAGDIQALFDEDEVNLPPLRPGLVGHQDFAEDRARRRLSLVHASRQFHPSRFPSDRRHESAL